MDPIRRAVLAYYRVNVDAWVTLKRWLALPRIHLWMAAGCVQFAAVVALVGSGHLDAAWVVAAACAWLPVLQRILDR